LSSAGCLPGGRLPLLLCEVVASSILRAGAQFFKLRTVSQAAVTLSFSSRATQVVKTIQFESLINAAFDPAPLTRKQPRHLPF